MLDAISVFMDRYSEMLLQGIWETLIMTVLATLFAYLIGLPLGALLVVTNEHGIHPNKAVNSILGWIVNIGRSLPFIILMVLLMPVTKSIMGTKLGIRGAVFPLVIAAAPFVARMVETSLEELDAGVLEAAHAMGATGWQIFWKFYLPEALPSLVRGGSISLITIMSYTAIAGAIGAGGLGDIAIRYGYNRYEFGVLIVTVVLLIILVEIFQCTFNVIARKIDKRIRK